MTPKEKAQELVQRFIDEAYAETTEQLYTPIAKKAALIAVDELIRNTIRTYEECFNHDHWDGGYDTKASREAVAYWQEVKQEIENL